mmetsp:Transcript_6006/g.20483  ORF Transcript_6006/g.20483 Transcript_6006/m.20483 type:complete len:1835 (+) Transcript_6006:197-5701(+)
MCGYRIRMTGRLVAAWPPLMVLVALLLLPQTPLASSPQRVSVCVLMDFASDLATDNALMCLAAADAFNAGNCSSFFTPGGESCSTTARGVALDINLVSMGLSTSEPYNKVLAVRGALRCLQLGSAAIVSLGSSTQTSSLALSAQIMGIPTVSPTSESNLLSDRVVFPFFSRTIPREEEALSALVGTLKVFKWTNSFVLHDIYTHSPDISHIMELVVREIPSASISGFPLAFADMDPVGVNFALKLAKNSGSRVIVVLATALNLDLLFFAADDVGMFDGTYVWLLTTGTDPVRLVQSSRDPARMERLCDGIMRVDADSFSSGGEGLGVKSFFPEYFGEGWNSTIESRLAPGQGVWPSPPIASDYVNPFLAYAFDQVWAVGEVFDLIARGNNITTDHGDCPAYLSGTQGHAVAFQEYVTALQFEGATGRVAFTSLGDRDWGGRSIYIYSHHYKEVPGERGERARRVMLGGKVGKWTPEGGVQIFEGADIRWPDGTYYPSVPSSKPGGDGGRGWLGSWRVTIIICAMFPLLLCACLVMYRCFSSSLVEAYLRHMERTQKLRGPPAAGDPVVLCITDIQNSTALWDKFPTEMNVAQMMHDRLMRSLLKEHCAYECSTEGDSFTLAFHDPVDAVGYCVDVQEKLMKENWPEVLEDGGGSIIMNGDDTKKKAYWARAGLNEDASGGEKEFSRMPVTFTSPSSQKAKVIDNFVDKGFTRDDSRLQKVSGAIQRSANSVTFFRGRPGRASTGSPALDQQRAMSFLFQRGGYGSTYEEDDQTMSVFKGLRVRMGLHMGVPDRVDVNAASNRTVYSGTVTEVAKYVSEAACGGQIIMSGAVIGAMSTLYGSSESAARGTYVHLGRHLLREETTKRMQSMNSSLDGGGITTPDSIPTSTCDWDFFPPESNRPSTEMDLSSSFDVLRTTTDPMQGRTINPRMKSIDLDDKSSPRQLVGDWNAAWATKDPPTKPGPFGSAITRPDRSGETGGMRRYYSYGRRGLDGSERSYTEETESPTVGAEPDIEIISRRSSGDKGTCSSANSAKVSREAKGKAIMEEDESTSFLSELSEECSSSGGRKREKAPRVDMLGGYSKPAAPEHAAPPAPAPPEPLPAGPSKLASISQQNSPRSGSGEGIDDLDMEGIHVEHINLRSRLVDHMNLQGSSQDSSQPDSPTGSRDGGGVTDDLVSGSSMGGRGIGGAAESGGGGSGREAQNSLPNGITSGVSPPMKIPSSLTQRLLKDPNLSGIASGSVSIMSESLNAKQSALPRLDIKSPSVPSPGVARSPLARDAHGWGDAGHLHTTKDTHYTVDLIMVIPFSLHERYMCYPKPKTKCQLSPGYYSAPSRENLTIVFTFIDQPQVDLASPKDRSMLKEALLVHNECIRHCLYHARGYECEESGGNFLLAFHTARHAVVFCREAQRRLMDVKWSDEIYSCTDAARVTFGEKVIFNGLRVKMGITTGAATRRIPSHLTGRADYFGPLLNHAARMASMANPGQVVASRTTVDEVSGSDKQHAALGFISLGKHILMGSQGGAVELFHIEIEPNSQRGVPALRGQDEVYVAKQYVVPQSGETSTKVLNSSMRPNVKAPASSVQRSSEGSDAESFVDLEPGRGSSHESGSRSKWRPGKRLHRQGPTQKLEASTGNVAQTQESLAPRLIASVFKVPSTNDLAALDSTDRRDLGAMGGARVIRNVPSVILDGNDEEGGRRKHQNLAGATIKRLRTKASVEVVSSRSTGSIDGRTQVGTPRGARSFPTVGGPRKAGGGGDVSASIGVSPDTPSALPPKSRMLMTLMWGEVPKAASLGYMVVTRPGGGSASQVPDDADVGRGSQSRILQFTTNFGNRLC